MNSPAVHILTGEYPPQPGGVSDYCEQVATGLAEQGVPVHVWSPGTPSGEAPDGPPGVHVHRVAGLFSLRGLGRLARALDREPTPRVLLLQYAPNALGSRGMNMAACLWLLIRSRRDEVRVMFHEPYFYFGVRHLHRNVLAVVQRLMAVVLLGASRLVYLSSGTWERYLSHYMWLGGRQLMWLPIPATVPRCDDDVAVRRCRAELSGGDSAVRVIGHFGTYGAHVRPLLESCFTELAGLDSRLRFACLGRNSSAFVASLDARVPGLRGRVVASGGVESRQVAARLRACDVVVQPFADGVTTRRTSLMASLVNGCPTVTTVGSLTEPIWVEEDGVAVARVGDAAGLASRVLELLADDARRLALGRAGADLYDRRFALRHVVRQLTTASAGPRPPGAPPLP